MWKQGKIVSPTSKSTYEYYAKVYEIGSEYGIEGGRISKLSIRKDGKAICNYDRGWDIVPTVDDDLAVLHIILTKYSEEDSDELPRND